MKNICKPLWETQLSILKSILKLMEFKFGGRESDQFLYVKEQVMNNVYESTKKFFLEGMKEGYFERCSCGASLRQGWDKCPKCAGAGFCDKE